MPLSAGAHRGPGIGSPGPRVPGSDKRLFLAVKVKTEKKIFFGFHFCFKTGFLCDDFGILKLILIDQVGLRLIRDPPASASRALGLGTTTAW